MNDNTPTIAECKGEHPKRPWQVKYRITPAYEQGEHPFIVSDHILISRSRTFGYAEVSVFLCNEDGEPLSFMEIISWRSSTLTDPEILAYLGYTTIKGFPPL